MDEFKRDSKRRYLISNCGCDDIIKKHFEFNEDEFLFLNLVFEELNKNSTYGCMPKIYIKPADHIGGDK